MLSLTGNGAVDSLIQAAAAVTAFGVLLGAAVKLWRFARRLERALTVILSEFTPNGETITVKVARIDKEMQETKRANDAHATELHRVGEYLRQRSHDFGNAFQALLGRNILSPLPVDLQHFEEPFQLGGDKP